MSKFTDFTGGICEMFVTIVCTGVAVGVALSIMIAIVLLTFDLFLWLGL